MNAIKPGRDSIDLRAPAHKKDLRDRMDQAAKEAKQREDDLHRELRDATRREKEAREECQRRLDELRKATARENEVKIAQLTRRLKEIDLDLEQMPMKKADGHRELLDEWHENEARVKALYDGRGDARNPGRDPSLKAVYDDFLEKNRRHQDEWRDKEQRLGIERDSIQAQIDHLKAGIEAGGAAATPAPAPAAQSA